jgi:hypothetical protein
MLLKKLQKKLQNKTKSPENETILRAFFYEKILFWISWALWVAAIPPWAVSRS